MEYSIGRLVLMPFGRSYISLDLYVSNHYTGNMSFSCRCVSLLLAGAQLFRCSSMD